MGGQYAHLIGILGAFNAGKTCLINSLYLSVAHGGVADRYMFAGSLTIEGLDQRARLVRKWTDGALPDKLAEHTTLDDERNPGLLHLSLKDDKVKHILLTDIPGEWTPGLINQASTSYRFEFLKRADGIIYVIDGPQLHEAETRHTETRQAKLFLQRLRDTLGIDMSIPFVLFISKCDEFDGFTEPAGLSRVVEDARYLGFAPTVILGAAFSSQPEVIKSGTGVIEAIETVIQAPAHPTGRPNTPTTETPSRAFARFRRRH